MKLVIAEKPSVAGEISKVIGASKKENGYYSGNGYYVSWCVGHLIELAEPEDYNVTYKKWRSDDLPIIPDTYKTKIVEKTATQYKILEQLANRSDVESLICATDAAREGELIFRLVYEKTGCKKPFKRLWISSMEESAIKSGFENMKDGKEYDNLHAAAECRQRSDWLVGINITRLYTTIYGKLLHVGRVQTPTISLIVKRQLEIKNFKSKTTFAAIADFGTFKAISRDFENKNEAEQLAARCKGKIGTVKSVEKENKKENPPALYDLTTLQRDANRLLGYSAQQTLDVAQALYEKKLATYPRTESRYITADMENSTKALIHRLIQNKILGEDVIDAYDTNFIKMNQIVNDKKVTDHHAIIPTTQIGISDIAGLPTAEKNIMLLIIMRVLTAPYAPHIFEATKATINIVGEDFKTSGKEIIQEGFKSIEKRIKDIIKEAEREPVDSSDENATLPPLQKGDAFDVVDSTLKTKKTQPPKPYTEDTLLSAMETAGRSITDESLKEAMKDCGLGTPATRANVIENIIKSGYIERNKKQLIPTETAYAFNELVTDKLKEAEMTAEWEKKLEAIKDGKMAKEVFMMEISEYVRSLVNAKKQDDNTEAKSMFRDSRESIGICPICKKNIIEYPKSYSCESGKTGCGFIFWKMVAGKEITKTQIKKLLEKRKTDLIKGFKSKSGKDFDAYLVLKEDNTTAFVFDDKKKF